MRDKDVPQDPSFYAGHRRACYAVDEQGKYVVALSRGFEAETAATALSVEEFEETLEGVRRRCRAGEMSPIAFHMAARKMTPALLAASAGIARWRLRRHLRPGVFRRLPARIIARYAEALAVTPEELRHV